MRIGFANEKERKCKLEEMEDGGRWWDDGAPVSETVARESRNVPTPHRCRVAWSLQQADDEAKSRFAWFRWPASTTPAGGGRPMEGVEWGDSWTLAGSYE